MSMLRDQKKVIGYVLGVIASCLEDLSLCKKSGRLIYNLDFCLLFPHFFNKPAIGSREYLLSAKEWMPRLLNEASTCDLFTIAISGPTFFEFLDQLKHQIDDFKINIPTLAREQAQKNIRYDGLIKSTKIRDKLSILSSRRYWEGTSAPIEKLIGYLNTGAVTGIGDYVSKPSQKTTAYLTYLFDKLINDQIENRMRHDSRNPEDCMFHYKIDAFNICLAILCSRECQIPMPLVTCCEFMLQNCTDSGNTLGRMDRVPLFLKNAYLAEKKKEIPNMEDFLAGALRAGSNLSSILMRNNNDEDISPYERDEIAVFHHIYVRRLSTFSENNTNDFDEREIDEIIDTIENEKRMNEILEKAVIDIQCYSQKLVESYLNKINVSYLNEFGFRNDPILEKIRKELNIERYTELRHAL
jgi:hypothetical protein